MPDLEAPPVIADESEQACCEDEQTGRAQSRYGWRWRFAEITADSPRKKVRMTRPRELTEGTGETVGTTGNIATHPSLIELGLIPVPTITCARHLYVLGVPRLEARTCSSATAPKRQRPGRSRGVSSVAAQPGGLVLSCALDL